MLYSIKISIEFCITFQIWYLTQNIFFYEIRMTDNYSSDGWILILWDYLKSYKGNMV